MLTIEAIELLLQIPAGGREIFEGEDRDCSLRWLAGIIGLRFVAGVEIDAHSNGNPWEGTSIVSSGEDGNGAVLSLVAPAVLQLEGRMRDGYEVVLAHEEADCFVSDLFIGSENVRMEAEGVIRALQESPTVVIVLYLCG